MKMITKRPVKFTGDGAYLPVGTQIDVDGEEGKRLSRIGAAAFLSESEMKPGPTAPESPRTEQRREPTAEPKPVQAAEPETSKPKSAARRPSGKR